jgi:hypothetical protein
MRKTLLGVSVLMLASPLAQAADIDSLGSLSQSQFKAFSKDMGAVVGYKAIAPAEPLGITGFDIGVEVSTTTLDNASAFDAACSGCGDKELTVPKVHLHKGLPASIDVGLVFARVPSSNIKLTGAELRYAFLDGSAATPALALRATYSRLDGVDQLSMDTRGVELTISKGLAMFTPYAGIGQNWVNSSPASNTGLKDENFTQQKYYVGLNVNLGLTNLAVEGDRTGDSDTVSAKLGFRF